MVALVPSCLTSGAVLKPNIDPLGEAAGFGRRADLTGEREHVQDDGLVRKELSFEMPELRRLELDRPPRGGEARWLHRPGHRTGNARSDCCPGSIECEVGTVEKFDSHVRERTENDISVKAVHGIAPAEGLQGGGVFPDDVLGTELGYCCCVVRIHGGVQTVHELACEGFINLLWQSALLVEGIVSLGWGSAA